MTALVAEMPRAWARQGAALSAEGWLRDVYDTHWAPMVRLAALMLDSRGEGEEIVQDAILAVYDRRDQFPDARSAGGYLRTAVVNRCRSVHRHRAVVQRHRPHELPTPEQPDAVAIRNDVGDQVMAALRTLPQRQREVLVLRYYSEASEAEIAEALGISRGAVKSHAHRGMQALRVALAEVAR